MKLSNLRESTINKSGAASIEAVRRYERGTLTIAILELDSLQGCPQMIKEGSFDCSYNRITSLIGGPTHVDFSYICVHNELTDLSGCATSIGASVACNHNRLTSLHGIPREIFGFFDCYHNPDLKTLEDGPKMVAKTYNIRNTGVISLNGGPRTVGASFICSHTPITSLEHFPEHVGGDMLFDNTKLTDLHDVHLIMKYVNGRLNISGTNIRSHVLGLILVKGLTGVTFSKHLAEVSEIINRYLGLGRVGVMKAQRELLEAGYEEFAKL